MRLLDDVGVSNTASSAVLFRCPRNDTLNLATHHRRPRTTNLQVQSVRTHPSSLMTHSWKSVLCLCLRIFLSLSSSLVLSTEPHNNNDTNNNNNNVHIFILP